MGVFARYPQYRPRSNSVETIDYRVNDCFRRSMNGTPLASETYGTTDADNSVVVVLRHGGIPIGMDALMWAKYKFGEFFKINDGATSAPAVRNPFSKVKPGELPIPGMALDELSAKGVLFGICNVALTVYSGIFAKSMGLRADAVRQDWVASLLPGVQIVPSGVIAVNRTQERGCAYCFAG